jgi:hypothetical protein
MAAKLFENDVAPEIFSNTQSLPVGLGARAMVAVVDPVTIADPRTTPPCPVHVCPCRNWTEQMVSMLIPVAAASEIVRDDWPGLTSKTTSKFVFASTPVTPKVMTAGLVKATPTTISVSLAGVLYT